MNLHYFLVRNTVPHCGGPCKPLIQCFTASSWEMCLLIPNWTIFLEQGKSSYWGLEVSLTSLKSLSEEWPWTSCWRWRCLLQRTLRPRGMVGISCGDSSQKAQGEPCWLRATARQQQHSPVASAGRAGSNIWKLSAQSADVVLADSVGKASNTKGRPLRLWSDHTLEPPVSLPWNTWMTSSKLVGT